jgi:hypothetical protein
MTVSKLLQEAFREANAKYPHIAAKWVRASFRVGGRLPNSLLSVSLQREGQFDVLLRCLEDELAPQIRGGAEADIYGGHYMNMLAAYWIGGMYETCRLLNDRQLGDEGEPFATIFRHLELVRVIIEKHEIPKDRVLREPLGLQKYPTYDGLKDTYVYDKADPSRAHIPLLGASEYGSAMWQVIDLRDNTEFWVDRRSLSDQILELWTDNRAPEQ